MLLQDYLNLDFYEFTDNDNEKLVNHFFEKFGVNVKIEGDLYLFKYDMIAAKWLAPITHFCRGTIMRNTSDGWVICSRPWEKFFNQHEGHCPVFKDFASYVQDPTSYVMEKADGTAIQVWYDTVKAEWRISTLGTITPTNINQENITFDVLFKSLVPMAYNNFDGAYMDKGCTFLFELCSKHNRILTKYPKDCVFLISIRNNETGVYYNDNDRLFFTKVLEVKSPIQFSFKELGLKNLSDVIKFVEDESKKSDAYGEFSEGFVCYRNGTPVAKIKNQTYLSLHHLSGGDPIHTRNYIIEAFFNANMDDVMKVIDDDMKEFVEKIRVWYVSKVESIIEDIKKIGAQTYATQKDYALAVQTLKDPALLSMYFTNKEKILKGQFGHEDINDWFKKFFGKYEKELKALHEVI